MKKKRGRATGKRKSGRRERTGSRRGQLGKLEEKKRESSWEKKIGKKREGRKTQGGIALFFLSLVCALFCFATPLLLASRRVAYQFASPYLRKPGTRWTLLQPLVISLCFQPPGSFLSPLHFISFSSFLNFAGALLLFAFVMEDGSLVVCERSLFF